MCGSNDFPSFVARALAAGTVAVSRASSSPKKPSTGAAYAEADRGALAVGARDDGYTDEFCCQSHGAHFTVAAAGFLNLSGPMATFGCTSVSRMLDWPSVHVMSILNGTLTPATSR